MKTIARGAYEIPGIGTDMLELRSSEICCEWEGSPGSLESVSRRGGSEILDTADREEEGERLTFER